MSVITKTVQLLATNNATTLDTPAAPEGLVVRVLARVVDNLNFGTVVLTVLLAAILYDQCMYIIRKGPIAGPYFKVPFIGPFLEAVYPNFVTYQAKWDSGALSCVSVFHKFVVIASTRDMARKIFNAPAYVKPCVVDIAHKLLRPNNWVFLDGRAHVDYRKGLNGLFTRKALEIYLPGQEDVYNKYFKLFVEQTDKNGGKPRPFMPDFRVLMCAVSLRTFVGHYISEPMVKKIAEDYYWVTAALDLVNFPFIIPFTRTWFGKRAADMILDEFSKCAAKSKVAMRAGGKAESILDQWVSNMLRSEEYRQRIEKGETVPQEEKPDMMIRWFSDLEISMTLFTFLFASQDATSSACTWLFQIMADRPDLLDKVREENLRLRGGDVHAPLTIDLLEGMTYTRAVVKEVLRYRPPVIMVPYEVKKDYPVTESYTLKKGSMVVPSIYPALHDPEAYPDPDHYDPDRWITGDAEKQTKNWLVFGVGPHYCLGQNYAVMNLMAMIGKASLLLDWEHQVTPKSEHIKVFATLFPMDDCLLAFKHRTN